jgi:hypothetical protein
MPQGIKRAKAAEVALRAGEASGVAEIDAPIAV